MLQEQGGPNKQGGPQSWLYVFVCFIQLILLPEPPRQCHSFLTERNDAEMGHRYLSGPLVSQETSNYSQIGFASKDATRGSWHRY